MLSKAAGQKHQLKAPDKMGYIQKEDCLMMDGNGQHHLRDGWTFGDCQ
jgi:hypothetical protein